MTEVDGSCVAEEDCEPVPDFRTLLDEALIMEFDRTLTKENECEDRNTNCERWIEREGVCETKKYMQQNCPRACGLCSSG